MSILIDTWNNVDSLTPAAIAKLCDSPLCWSLDFHRYSDLVKRSLRHCDTLSIYLEDIAENRRVCVECRLGFVDTWIKVTALTDYNPEKQCWEHWLGERSNCIDGKRGRKPLTDYRDKLWTDRSSWRSNGNQFKFSATKKNGIWVIYGC